MRIVGGRRARGTTTFVITNNGAKVTEFYVYADGGGVLGEAENISPACSAS